MALSFQCERCGVAGTVRAAEAGTPTLVKCSACGHTFITGGPLGAPRVSGPVRAPTVPVAPNASASRPRPPPVPAARPPATTDTVAPIGPLAGTEGWTKTEISPDEIPPPVDGYVEFTLDDDPPAPPVVERAVARPPAPPPASPPPAPPSRGASARAAPAASPPVPFPRRETIREPPRSEPPRVERTPPPLETPPPLSAAPEPSQKLHAPAFEGVPPPPDRRWLPFAAVGAAGLLVGGIVAFILLRDPKPEAPKDATVASAPGPASKAPPEPAREPQPEPQPEPARDATVAARDEAAPSASRPAAPAPAPVAASEPKPAAPRTAPPARVAPERREAPPAPPAASEPERAEQAVARRAPAPEAEVVPVPPASPASKDVDVTTAVFTPPPAESPAIEDAPVYPSDGFRRPTAADPGCVQRSLRLPRELKDRVPSTVPVRFAVGPDGSVSQFSVLADVPDRRVGEAIWDAIRSCRFNPGADARGRPVRLWVVLPIRFVGR